MEFQSSNLKIKRRELMHYLHAELASSLLHGAAVSYIYFQKLNSHSVQ